jgi:hypothetical protein
LETLLIDDAFVGKGFENCFVFLSGLLLLFALGFLASVFLVGVTRQRRGATQGFPGACQTDPIRGATQDFDPVCASGRARGKEDGVAVADASEAGSVVSVPEVFLGWGLEEGVAEKQGMEGVSEERVVRE